MGTEPKRPKDGTVDYLKKPDFGKKPAYLERVKEEVAEEYRQINEWKQTMEMQAAPPGMRQLEEDERLAILDGLKQKWTQLNKQYQTMSFTVDTINKRTRYVRAALGVVEGTGRLGTGRGWSADGDGSNDGSVLLG